MAPSLPSTIDVAELNSETLPLIGSAEDSGPGGVHSGSSSCWRGSRWELMRGGPRFGPCSVNLSRGGHACKAMRTTCKHFSEDIALHTAIASFDLSAHTFPLHSMQLVPCRSVLVFPPILPRTAQPK